jgi:hypothetical protein
MDAAAEIRRTAHFASEWKSLSDGGSYRFSGPDAPESTVLASSELYLPGSSGTAPASTMMSSRIGHTASLLKDGRVLIVGGSDSNRRALATAEFVQDKQ